MNGPALAPPDDKLGAEIGRVLALMSVEMLGRRNYIGGSSRQSPGASVLGIIVGGDNPEVAMLVERGAVRGLGVSSTC